MIFFFLWVLEFFHTLYKRRPTFVSISAYKYDLAATQGCLPLYTHSSLLYKCICVNTHTNIYSLFIQELVPVH